MPRGTPRVDDERVDAALHARGRRLRPRSRGRGGRRRDDPPRSFGEVVGTARSHCSSASNSSAKAVAHFWRLGLTSALVSRAPSCGSLDHVSSLRVTSPTVCCGTGASTIVLTWHRCTERRRCSSCHRSSSRGVSCSMRRWLRPLLCRSNRVRHAGDHHTRGDRTTRRSL